MNRKYLFVLTAIMLMVFSTGCASRRTNVVPPNSLAGAWELVPSPESNFPLLSRKYLSDSHFVVVRFTHDGAISAAHGGTYTFSNGRHVENVLFSTAHNMINTTSTFTVDYSNGMKTISGTFGNGIEITEVWRRTSSSTSALSGIWHGSGGSENWKIISNTEFITFTANEQGRITLLTGGIYVWDAESIIEHIDFSFWPGIAFTRSTFAYELTDNSLTLRGLWENVERELFSLAH